MIDPFVIKSDRTFIIVFGTLHPATQVYRTTRRAHRAFNHCIHKIAMIKVPSETNTVRYSHGDVLRYSRLGKSLVSVT